MYKNILKILNGLCFFLAFLAVVGSVNKPSGFLPDSQIYLASLFGACAVYLFNFWTLQQKEHLKASTISDVVNVGAGALFILGMSTKPAGDGADILLLFLMFLPLIGTPIYLRK